MHGKLPISQKLITLAIITCLLFSAGCEPCTCCVAALAVKAVVAVGVAVTADAITDEIRKNRELKEERSRISVEVPPAGAP